MTPQAGAGHRPHETDSVRLLRPAGRRLPDRHVLLGVSHPSDDPARHRVFEVRATYDETKGGWVALVGEQNLNEQRGAWQREIAAQSRPTAAECLGFAVALLVARVDQEAGDEA